MFILTILRGMTFESYTFTSAFTAHYEAEKAAIAHGRDNVTLRRV